MAIINFNSISGVSTVTATHSVTVGDTFIKDSKVGLGTISTSDRNAGVGTAVGTIIYNETDKVIQLYKRLAGWVNIGTAGDVASVAPSGLTASGGMVSDYTDPGPGNVYRAHIFTASGTFDVTALSSSLPNTVEYLVVAGGGGGGEGGGGAGGLRTNLSGHTLDGGPYSVSVQSYTVIVGAGGRGGTQNSTNYSGQSAGRQGGNSEFYPTPATYPSGTYIRSVGGGGGGGYSSEPGGTGGSGGGGCSGPGQPATPGLAGNTPTDPNHPEIQGYAGGDGGSGFGGGGGGASESGNTDASRAGGDGIQVLIAESPAVPAPQRSFGADGGYFAGGGEGGGPTGGGASLGGGGSGVASAVNAGSGTANTGGGGGGAWNNNYKGGEGGSGIVVVRYQIGQLAAAAKATGGAISYVGSKTVHVFTNAGTFTAPSPLNPTPLSVEYFMVGGGGAGGSSDGGGGGGAGGIMTNIPGIIPAPATGSSMALTPGTGYPVSIGSGGSIGNQQANPGSQGGDGNPTTFNSITAGGGGGGGSGAPSSPNSGRDGLAGGGSGGGGGASPGGSSAGGAGNGHGFAGRAGSPTEPAWQGGGGGGAGEAGQTLGVGGDGLQLPTTYHDPSQSKLGDENPAGPSWGWFSGGGGGGDGDASNHSNAGTPGGVGGGGRGESAIPPSTLNTPATNGAENTGGGGGGKDLHTTGIPAAGNGGSGIVIIAYDS